MLMSICIPTKDRHYILTDTLRSIFDEPVDKNLYEVVISDNSDDDLTFKLADEYRNKGMNVVYYKNTEKGFYNSIQALVLGNGQFLKLHNDYTKFKPGCFQQLIDLVTSNIELKPQMLFTDGNLKFGTSMYFSDFDSFLAGSSYWNTWSSAFSIWKDDLHSLPRKKSDLNDQFPHTSLLFYNTNKDCYLIDDRVLFENSKVAKKGGYNIFYNFCVLYVEMLLSLNNSGAISLRTFKSIKRRMAYLFVSSWYCNSVICKSEFSFDNSNYIKNILRHYNCFDLAVVIALAYLKKTWRVINHCFKWL
jgi:abequosyltransferase